MVEDQHGGHALDLGGLRRFLTRARRRVGVETDVGVRLMRDAAIGRLNRDFRRHDGPTDVLSFPESGDIAISLDTAARQASARRHPLDTEVRILMLHGLLHLAGHDHERDRGEMALREQELRQALGLPEGLTERAGALAHAAERTNRAKSNRGARHGGNSQHTLS